MEMSAKLPYSSMEDNPNLQKQIGCMNGIYQLFDRHHFFISRGISSHNHKRLPPGHTRHHGMKPINMTQKAMEKNLDEAMKEKKSITVESPRTSLSSSSCSSSTFSSVDWNKIVQTEPACLGHNIFPGTPSQMLPIKQPNSSLHLGRPSIDLRDVVKDSIYRETYGSSIKNSNRAQGLSNVVKHVDSPRPLQVSKYVKPVPSGLDGSFQCLAKLPEAAPQSSNKEGSQALPPKDAPRFSYDGRESRDVWKSSTKIKELPRLSLDSREGSIRRSASESRSNYLLDDLKWGHGMSCQTLIQQHEPESNKRSSSVVAKLMGLEAFPDAMSGQDRQIRKIKCCPSENLDTMPTSSSKARERKHNQVSSSPRTTQRESTSHKLRNVNSAIKPNSRFPLEPAPWRQLSHKQTSIYPEAEIKAQNSCPSVYGEIEERLTELEFRSAGKDLRALKQILEAMQKSRERLENKKEDHASNLEPQTSNHGTNYHNLNQNFTLATQCRQIASTIKGAGSPKKLESSIVIIKPAKLAQKPRNSGSSAIPVEGISGLHKLRTRDNTDSRKDLFDKQTAKDLSPRNQHFRVPTCQPVHSMDKSTNTRTSKPSQTSKAPQHMSGGIPASFGRSSTVSPRLEQQKHSLEKQSHPNTQSSDSSRSRRHLSKQQRESGSPCRKLKPRSPNLQPCDDRLSEVSSETRISVQSESNISLASQTDVEVTSTDRSKEINSTYQLEGQNNEQAGRLSKDSSKSKPTTAILEQPSPISVLDTTVYREESPSPVKKTSHPFKGEEMLYFDEADWNLIDLDQLPNSAANLSPEFDQTRLENTKHLAHKLRQECSTCDEAANTNPEHRYIMAILLASGLLHKDPASSLTIIQPHTSGHLIKPNLFFVLEQARDAIELQNDENGTEKTDRSILNEKFRRKLIFDTVNEILVRKFISAGYSEPWISPSKRGGILLSGQKLLKELCSEMDHLQPNPNCILSDEDNGLISILSNDMIHQTQNWADYHTDIPGVVLDIERQIFKDLIAEVVSGVATGLQGRPTRHCRTLFSK